MLFVRVCVRACVCSEELKLAADVEDQILNLPMKKPQSKELQGSGRFSYRPIYVCVCVRACVLATHCQLLQV
jgi:hypothetical protein